MRPAVFLGLISLLAGECLAQRGPGLSNGVPPNSMPLGNPLPPLSPIPPAGGSLRPPTAPRRGTPSGGFFPLPYYPASYYPAPYSDPAPPPTVTIIQQFATPPAAPAVVAPVISQIQEYQAPASAPAPGVEPAMFSIVLKDGSVLQATVAMVQGNTLQFVDAEGRQRRVPESAIDRDATRRSNAQRNLRLQLPPPPAP